MNDQKKERIIVVAEQVKLLFGFCAALIPDKDMLEDVMELSDDRASTVMAAIPIFGALGMDWEKAEMESKIKSQRATALFNLIDTLDKTEKMRAEFMEKELKKGEGRQQLGKALGLI